MEDNSPKYPLRRKMIKWGLYSIIAATPTFRAIKYLTFSGIAATPTIRAIKYLTFSGDKTNENGLCDIEFNSFRKYENAEEFMNSLKKKLDPELKDYLQIWSEKGGKHHVILNINSPKNAALEIHEDIKRNRLIDDIKFIYGDKETKNKLNNYSVLKFPDTDNPVRDLILTYLTAYSNSDIIPTTKTIRSENKEKYISVNTDWIKTYLSNGDIEGKDYNIVELNSEFKETNSIYSIVSNFTRGKLDDIIESIIDYNSIEKGQETKLWDKINLAIPAKEYRDIIKPRPIDDLINNKDDSNDPAYKPVKPDPNRPKISDETQEYGGNVILRTNMPAVLFESFFMSNDNDLEYYSQDENLYGLTDLCCKGIDNYFIEKGVKYSEKEKRKVILVVGHGIMDDKKYPKGKSDPGANREFKGKKYREDEFNMKMANKMKSELDKIGYGAVILNYDGPAGSRKNQHKRWDYYVNEANKIGGKNDVLIDIHVNGNDSSKPSGTRVYVPRGNNPKSDLLGEKILEALYQKK